jgi:hypothetical protein
MMIGKFFHSYEGKTLHWQGQIVSEDRDGSYKIVLYEWIAGQPNGERFVRLSEMIGWKFFDTRGAWIKAYEKYEQGLRGK